MSYQERQKIKYRIKTLVIIIFLLFNGGFCIAQPDSIFAMQPSTSCVRHLNENT